MEKRTPLQALEIIDSRIILSGIKTAEEAQKVLDQEILLLRQRGNWIVPASFKGEITNEEYDEISREEYYGNNAAVRAAADFFKAHSSKKKRTKEIHEEPGLDGLSEIPRELIGQVRTQLSALEITGIHPWEAVSKIPQLEKQGTSKKKLQAIERLSAIARNITEILLQKVSKETRADGLEWKQRISWCKTPEDFSNFFKIYEIEDIQRLYRDQQGLYLAIVKDQRFGSWEKFLEFMGMEKREKWTVRVSRCITPKDFLALFAENNIEGDVWQRSMWLRTNEFDALYQAIVKNKRFGTWTAFLEFMGVEIREKWTDMVNRCKTRKDFRELFISLGIEGENWKSSGWLYRNFGGLYDAIARTERFGSWTSFLKFMGFEIAESWGAQVKLCKEQKDFITLFQDSGISGTDWAESSWLKDNGFGGLYQAIWHDERFGSWTAFLRFMGVEEIKGRWAGMARACKTKRDFNRMFTDLGIKRSEWTRGNHLLTNHGAVYRAIVRDERFGNWPAFLTFMGIEIQEKWTERIASTESKEGFLAIFAENNLSEEQWQSARWLQKNGCSGLYGAIVGDERFGDWKTFLKFMGVEVEDSWVDVVAACKSRRDFLRLFSKHGIQNWRSSGRSHWGDKVGIYFGIIRDERFGKWTTFLEFMGVEIAESWVSKVEKCETREDFLKLFRENDISDESWQESGKWLVNNGFGGLYQAICHDDRFKKWSGFLTFMGLELSESWPERIKKCRTKKHFLSLFGEEGIADTWKNTEWLATNGYYGLYRAIATDERFGNWAAFLQFMGEKVAEKWTDRVRGCKTRSDFQKLFSECGIEDDAWRSGKWLRRQGHDGLYQAITRGDERFGSWVRFLACMDGRLPMNGIQSVQEAQALLRAEILQLRSTGKWIVSADSSKPVSRAEYDEIAKEEYYNKNPVVRAVADLLKSSREKDGA